jgi:hypothetical protein
MLSAPPPGIERIAGFPQSFPAPPVQAARGDYNGISTCHEELKWLNEDRSGAW